MQIVTPSRLHFGLINPGPAIDGRRFGGAGMMIEEPGLRVAIHTANQWSFHGDLGARALAVYHRLWEKKPHLSAWPHEVISERGAPEHMGLGTGTQFSLALARLFAEALDWPERTAVELAMLTGRGLRSGIGIHGFDHGGFLVDAGTMGIEDVAVLVDRVDFPEEWRIVLVLPPWRAGMHGREEMEVFDDFQPMPESRVRMLWELTKSMSTALQGVDFPRFGDALYRFNREAGEAFRTIQGDVYADPRIAELIDWIRGQDVNGVGQSSWGPAVFAITRDESSAEDLADRLRDCFNWSERNVIVTKGCNHGARISEGEGMEFEDERQ